MLGNADRYDLDGVTRNAEREYPVFMAALKLVYPTYGLVWDRQRERWLCVTRLGPETLKAVTYCENDDTTYEDPSQDFIDKLVLSDWVHSFRTPEDVIAAMERGEQDTRDALLEQKRAEWTRARASLRGFFDTNPVTNSRVVCKPLHADHRAAIEAGLNPRPHKEVAA